LDARVPRLHRDAMTRVLERLLDGDPPAGGMLPREEAMADEYRISRGVVRETMRALEERSVLAVKHGRGARVLPTSDWNVLDPDVMAAMLDARDGDALLREITEYRAMLAPRAARLAAERRSDEDVEALRGPCSAWPRPPLPGRGAAAPTSASPRRPTSIASSPRRRATAPLPARCPR